MFCNTVTGDEVMTTPGKLPELAAKEGTLLLSIDSSLMLILSVHVCYTVEPVKRCTNLILCFLRVAPGNSDTADVLNVRGDCVYIVHGTRHFISER